MSSAFEHLPLEVFDLVAYHLTLPAYQSLRLASRRLNSLSFSSFAKTYFSDLTNTLGSASLNRLVEVANHRHLAGAVKLLDVKILCHRDYRNLTKIDRIGIYPPPKRFPKVPGIRSQHISEECTLYDDVFSGAYPRCIVDRLVSCLRLFSNLSVIRFRAYHSEPFGWLSGAMPEGDQLFRAKCFQAVLDAILKSGIQLSEFSLAKGSRTTHLSKCANLPYPSIQLQLPSMAAMRHCFERLENLTITIVTAYNGDSRVPGWENSLSNILACAPELKSLTLCLDRKSRISHYSAAVVRSIALSCQLANLKTFHLLNCSLHQVDLTKFLASHATTLTYIVLADVHLLSGDWPNLWASLQEFNALNFLRLASLEGTKSPMIFTKNDKQKFRITLDAEHSARSMHNLLDDLITACNQEIEHASMGH